MEAHNDLGLSMRSDVGQYAELGGDGCVQVGGDLWGAQGDQEGVADGVTDTPLLDVFTSWVSCRAGLSLAVARPVNERFTFA